MSLHSRTTWIIQLQLTARSPIFVKADGWNYSVEAARAGAAHAYVYNRTPVQKYGEILAAEREARAAGRGLWGPPCYGNTDAVPA